MFMQVMAPGEAQVHMELEEEKKVNDCARLVYQINKAYCESIGDLSQVDWEHTPESIKLSAIDGVWFHLENPEVTPEQSHENWMKFKAADGYVYGPVKDLIRKEHPCFVPYKELPQEQKSKDYIFRATVHNFFKLTA